MDQLTHNVRRSNWINIIRQCQDRPAGTTAKQWLVENDISEKSYYYWLRKIRREVCEQEGLQEDTNPSALSFVEIPVKTALDTTPVPAVPAAMTPVAVIRSGRLTLELSNDISESLLCRRCFMLEDAACIRRVVIACGYVDLRKGIDGLSMIIGGRYHQNPFEKGTLFLFCGRRSDRIKGLLWMGDGFLQLYKRLEAGSLSWPRTSEEAADLTEEQFRYLMMGLNPLNPKVREVTPQKPT